MKLVPTLCDSCLLRTGPDTCDAFPDGIPDEILIFGADHREPVDGDNGLVWQYDPNGAESYADWQSVQE